MGCITGYRDAYSVTRLGIKRLLEMKSDKFSFYETLTELKEALQQQTEGSKLIAIVTSSVFYPKDDIYHAYAICNVKEHGVNHLYLYDSRESYFAKIAHQEFGLAKQLGLTDLNIYYPDMSRQSDDGFDGFSYAIKDARLLVAAKNHRPETSKALNHYPDAFEFRLPQSFQYHAENFNINCFKKLLKLDLREQNILPLTPIKPNSLDFCVGLGLSLGIAALGLLAYQILKAPDITELAKNSLAP